MQTAVVRYQNRKTGRAVTLVATAHMGTNAYYKKLNGIIAGLEAKGALVCYEHISPAAEEEWATASDGERAARDFPGFASDRVARQALCRYFGWVEQDAELKYSPSWRNVDINDLELVRRAQPQNISEQPDVINAVVEGLTPEQVDLFGGSAFALMARLASLDRFQLVQRWSGALMENASRRVSHVMLGERNRAALAGLPPDADAVMLWGAGHLPGLAAGLKKAGYRRRSTVWVPVGELPAVWRCLKDFWTSAQSIG